jgi:hypothetical protein
MRYKKVFQERDHNHLEIQSKWLRATNSRLTDSLTDDKLRASKKKQRVHQSSGEHQGKSLGKI